MKRLAKIYSQVLVDRTSGNTLPPFAYNFECIFLWYFGCIFNKIFNIRLH